MVDVLKRALVGRKLRSEQLGETLLPKRLALPVFASDALSSVAYAPDEILLTLSLGGLAAYTMNWKVGIAVGLVLLTVVASYRQNVHAYPSGGGDYEVATTNFGRNAGLTVGSALLVDYVLTVAVSVSSGVQNAAAAIPILSGHEAGVATVLILVLMTMNLRGTKESGKAFAIPTYLFMFSIMAMALWGFVRFASGNLPLAESSKYAMVAEAPYDGAIMSVAMIFLLTRAFSSGCAALTGVEAISNGVPAFRKPKSKNAATTLLMLGLIAVTMLMSILVLARLMHLHYVQDPSRQLLFHGHPLGKGHEQHTVIGQLAGALYADFPPMFYLTIAMTGIILFLAANTAFNGFPVLGAILARDKFLPAQLDTRGDRLAFSNGIILLAIGAIILVQAFNAEVTRLIQLYIVGVFVSFVMSQAGMIRHWNRNLRSETDTKMRRHMMRSRVINAFGLFMTASVLVVVLITKFFAGAWIAILAMVAIFTLMKFIEQHYLEVARELAIDVTDQTLPSRVHAIVLVGRLHKPTLRALAYARVSRPSTLEALYVAFDKDASESMRERWEELDLQVPLKIIASPYRELVRPVIRYVKEVRTGSPRDVVTVYIPEYVVGHWWEQLLHNQTALRLKGRLLFMPGVMVTSVPYQLRSVVALGEKH